MRSILVDWMIQVQHHLLLSQETLYLAVGILDSVLHRRDVDPDNLQLVGITSMLIASKLEEYYAAEIKKLLHLTENSYVDFKCCRWKGLYWQLWSFRYHFIKTILSNKFNLGILAKSAGVLIAFCEGRFKI